MKIMEIQKNLLNFLRKKGIAKANQKNGAELQLKVLVCISEKDNNFSMIEINSETDFVAKNNEFIKFVEETIKLHYQTLGKMEKIF